MERVWLGVMMVSSALVIMGMLAMGAGWLLTWDFSFLWGPEVDTSTRWVRCGSLLVIGGSAMALATLLLQGRN